MQKLLGMVEGALTEDHPRRLLEQAALALLTYIEQDTDGFRILVRDSPVATSTGTFASLIVDIAGQVEHLLAGEFKARGFDAKFAPMYSQMLVGMVALTGQWWVDVRKPKKADVAAHLVNLGLERPSRPRGQAAGCRWRIALRLRCVPDVVPSSATRHGLACRP